jgi:hypothetical protein
MPLAPHTSSGKPPRITPRPDATGGLGCALVVAGAALAVSVVVLLAAFVASALLDNPRMSIAVTFGVLMSLVRLLRLRTNPTGRSNVIEALATLAWLPMMYVMVRNMSGFPWTGWPGKWSWPDLWSMEECTALAALWFFLATYARQATFDRIIRGATLATLVVVVLATSVGLARIRRPDADHYFFTGGGTTLHTTRFIHETASRVPLVVGETFTPVVDPLVPDSSFRLGDGTVVTYRRLPDPNWTFGDGFSCRLEGVSGVDYAVSHDETCNPLTILHDADTDIWLVFDMDPHWVSTPRWTFTGTGKQAGPPPIGDERSLSASPFSIANYAHSIAPPLAWTLGGLIGSVLGGVLFVLGLRRERRGKFTDANEATLQEDGWVVLRDGQRIPLTGAVNAAPGPIVVRLRPGSGASYREAGGGAIEAWHPGTLEQARAAVRDRATSLYACAWMSALLCGGPLILSGLGGSR